MDVREEQPTIFTIGHSNVELEQFLPLLAMHRIEVLADVRTSPYSRYASQFNRDVLEVVLARQGIEYVFLGGPLGGRPADAPLDEEGRPAYEAMAARGEFLGGIETLLARAAEKRVCVLCSEEDPGRCHRGLLLGRVLAERDVPVVHIRGDGTTETQKAMCLRMARGQLTLF